MPTETDQTTSTPYAILPELSIASFAAYAANGGGAGIARASELEPAAIVEEVRRSGLRGRGGAGFPTGVKWASVVDAAADEPVYLVCNAAEGEPGTYKDRVLMARNPYQLVEGVLIAARAVGARRSYIATKERFTEEAQRLEEAIAAAREQGWPGADSLELVLGPDEYLFGEESALLEVVEGKLPLPRILPPYQSGLFAGAGAMNPTVVNNVETLSHVTQILGRGAEAFRSVGTEEAPGTMVFTVVGDVANPGIYELPLGTSLRTLLCDIAAGEDVKAVISGVSNPIITAELLDLPMDFDSLTEAGAGLGSGGFMVYDTSRDMVQVTAVLARFLAIESCGQCPPCKLGTGDIYERLDRLVNGTGTAADIAAIRTRTATVTDANRCYLPVGAALLVRSALEEFAAEFDARIGTPSPPDVAVPVPKIVHIDTDDGAVSYDHEYYRKRSDWSYADAEVHGPAAVERPTPPGVEVAPGDSAPNA
jgi:NADH-quinone oxidoreductase subunit F